MHSVDSKMIHCWIKCIRLVFHSPSIQLVPSFSTASTRNNFCQGWDAIATVADAGGDAVASVTYEVYAGPTTGTMTAQTLGSPTDTSFSKAGRIVKIRSKGRLNT